MPPHSHQPLPRGATVLSSDTKDSALVLDLLADMCSTHAPFYRPSFSPHLMCGSPRTWVQLIESPTVEYASTCSLPSWCACGWVPVWDCYGTVLLLLTIWGTACFFLKSGSWMFQSWLAWNQGSWETEFGVVKDVISEPSWFRWTPDVLSAARVILAISHTHPMPPSVCL